MIVLRISFPASLGAAILAVALSGVSPASAATYSPYFMALPEAGATELQTARFDAVAAPLPDGGVLIAGGEDDGITLRSAELFDPATDTFTVLPESGGTELHTAREGAVAAALPDGQVLIAGGYNKSDGSLRSAELFDPATGTFRLLAEAGDTELQSAGYGAVAAPLPDGQVLIAGGYDGSSYQRSAELFDPVTEAFSALPEAGATELQTARFDAVAAPLADGRVLIAGGQNSEPPLQGAELFDPGTKAFTALPEAGVTELQAAREGAVAAELAGGQVLIAGGYNGSELSSAELVGSFGELFTLLPEVDPTEPQSIRAGAVEASLPGGVVLIAGGYDGNNYLKSAELFYPAPTGPEGPTGPTGPSGPTGPIGPSGSMGATGSTGAAGPTGQAGASGTGGANGAQGPGGSTGAQGATGPSGPAGQIELVTCKAVISGKGKHKQTLQRCTTKLTSSPVTFTTGASIAAVLSRGGVVYATGSATRSRTNATKLLLIPRRPLGRGRYTLTFTRDGKRARETIAID